MTNTRNDKMITKKALQKLPLRLISPLIMFAAISLESSMPVIFFLKRIGNYLTFKNNTTIFDVIVVLGGGSVQRIHTSVKLFKKTKAKKLIIFRNIGKSKFSTGSTTTTQEAIYLGVKTKNIIHNNVPHNTEEEAKILYKIMISLNFHSAIIISDGYHMRRVSILFKHFIKNSDIYLNFYSTSINQFNPNNWWHKREDTENLILEYLALIVIWLKFKLGIL